MGSASKFYFVGLVGGLIMYWWGYKIIRLDVDMWHLKVNFKYHTPALKTCDESKVLHGNNNNHS